MRPPHLVAVTAVRGLARRFGRDRSVTLSGRAYLAGSLATFSTCQIGGCGAPATEFALGADGRQLAVCARCGEELEAILGLAHAVDPAS